MYKKDVIDDFGTERAVAKALGISDAAVSQWKESLQRKTPIDWKSLQLAP
ncbi:Cro/CI family transcriptional regulator [Escherichia coli]